MQDNTWMAALKVTVMIAAVTAMLVLMHGAAPAAEVGTISTFADSRVACAPYRIAPGRTWGVAHKTFPCGTMLRITNLFNGRSVTAPVVDLGPCTTAHCRLHMPRRIRQRIGDLLPMVARRLGSNGLFRGRIEAEAR